MRPWVTVQEGHNPKIKVDESEGHYSKPLHHVHSYYSEVPNKNVTFISILFWDFFPIYMALLGLTRFYVINITPLHIKIQDLHVMFINFWENLPTYTVIRAPRLLGTPE